MFSLKAPRQPKKATEKTTHPFTMDMTAGSKKKYIPSVMILPFSASSQYPKPTAATPAN